MRPEDMSDEELMMAHLQRPRMPLPQPERIDYLNELERRVGPERTDQIYDEIRATLKLIGVNILDLRPDK